MEKELIQFRVNLGRRIEEIRENRNLKQQELAAMLEGRDKQFINRYEKEGANPTAYILLQISKALNCTIDELFDFSKLSK